MAVKNKKEVRLKDIKIPLVFGILMFSLVFFIYSMPGFPGIKIVGATTTNDSEGKINLTISKVVSLELIAEEIDFGSFYVNTSCGECYVDTNGNISSCCVGANNITSGFELENTGNVNLSVNIQFDKNASEFLGHENASLQFIGKPDSDPFFGGQNGDTIDSCSGRLNPSSWTEASTAMFYVCGSTDEFILSPRNSFDSIIIHMKLVVPPKISGRKEINIIFTGTASS